MKQAMKRATALVLAAALALPIGAQASDALGSKLYHFAVTLAEGTEMVKQRLWSATYSDLRTEQYLTYIPTEGIRPVVAYGDKVTDRLTLTEMAARLEAEGKRVVGGVNGDYYVMSTGAPLGMVLSEGVLRSTPQYTDSWSLGFLADGTAFISQPQISVTAQFRGMNLSVAGGINKTRTVDGGYYLLTEEFAADTRTTQAGVDVILRPLSENLGEVIQVELPVQRTVEPDPQGETGDPEADPAQEGTGETAAPTEIEPAQTTPEMEADGETPNGEQTTPEAEADAEPPAGEQPDPETEADTEPTAGEQTTPEAEADAEPSEGEGTDPAQGEGTEETAPGETVTVPEPPARVTAAVTRSDTLKIGSAVTCEVVAVQENSQAIPVPEGCYVLTVNKGGNQWLVEQLASLTPGERVQFNVVAKDARWNEAVTGIGGMYQLVTGGVVLDGLDAERAPRSAVGIKADGSAVFYTLDGRQPWHSVGGTLTQVAQRLVELGCVEAVCLDGGGSTTFGVTQPNAAALTVENKPSDGVQRANSNALFLVSEKEPTGRLDRLHVTPADNLVLAGTTLQMTASAVDTGGHPMTYDGPVEWGVRNGEGLVSEDGLFMAGSHSGTTTVTAASGPATGAATVTVVDTPDSLTIYDEATNAAVTALALEPNQTVDLTGYSIWRHMALTSRDTSYTWTADPAVGTVDANGLFTAAPASGSGTLTVSAGERSVTIPVTVTGHILELASFERDVMDLIGTGSAFAELETDLEKARFGRGSARVTYELTEGAATLGTTLAVQPGERYLSLWVWGDGSGNRLSLQTTDGEGVTTQTALTALDFTGWKRVTAELPLNTVSVWGFTLADGGLGVPGGVLWLDQLTTANEQVVDEQGPQITVTVEGDVMRASVTDVLDKDLKKENMTVTLDGAAMDFEWDADGARITAAVPTDTELLHRVTVTARDASGNLARGSCSYTYAPPETWVEPFGDMAGHWSQPNTAYLWQQGITKGVNTDQGTLFLPENPITRGDFALMVARWQGLDLEAYADVELPFTDVELIPEWSLPAVKAMYAEGIMKGSLDSGELHANAHLGINRAEAMTILGRMQTRGYPTMELSFEDADAVPAWSRDYVAALVAQGVVSGYENKVHPTDPVKRGEVAKMLVSLM